MWFVLALLSAVFAALTSILAKIGIDGVNSNLATAIRTVVVVAMAWVMVFITGAQGGISEISRKIREIGTVSEEEARNLLKEDENEEYLNEIMDLFDKYFYKGNHVIYSAIGKLS